MEIQDHKSDLAMKIGLFFGFEAMLALMVFITSVGLWGMEKIQYCAEAIVSDRMLRNSGGGYGFPQLTDISTKMSFKCLMRIIGDSTS